MTIFTVASVRVFSADSKRSCDLNSLEHEVSFVFRITRRSEVGHIQKWLIQWFSNVTKDPSSLLYPALLGAGFILRMMVKWLSLL